MLLKNRISIQNMTEMMQIRINKNLQKASSQLPRIFYQKLLYGATNVCCPLMLLRTLKKWTSYLFASPELDEYLLRNTCVYK
jgi:hypothetical protein